MSKKYKIRLSACAKRQLAAFKEAGFETCLLAISIKNEFQSGLKLRAAVDWAHDHFLHVVADLGDTLDRHNIDETPEKALHLSRASGDAWLKANSIYLGSVMLTR